VSWASAAIERLQRGETVTIRPRGHSMAGKVNDGDRVTVVPAAGRELAVGDIVLVRVQVRAGLPASDQGVAGRAVPDRQQPRRH
jgi:hypothetical protein